MRITRLDGISRDLTAVSQALSTEGNLRDTSTRSALANNSLLTLLSNAAKTLVAWRKDHSTTSDEIRTLHINPSKETLLKRMQADANKIEKAALDTTKKAKRLSDYISKLLAMPAVPEGHDGTETEVDLRAAVTV